jgi:hypothetical protein
MRYAMLAAATLAVAALTSPALAAKKSSPGLPTWDECYWLGWDRGVHVEQDELDGFMDQCLVGAVPFDNQIGIRIAFPAHEGREVTVAARSPQTNRQPQRQPVHQQFHQAHETTD